MATTSFQGSGGSDHDGLPAKQPEGGFSKLLSTNLDRISSKPFSQAPGDVLINSLIYLIIASLKFSLITFPAFTAILLISYAGQYSIPIVEIAATAFDVILYLVLTAIFVIFVLTVVAMLPAFVARGFSQSVRNTYLIYRPYPNKYSRNFFVQLSRMSLSFGGMALYFFHIFLVLWMLGRADIQEYLVLNNLYYTLVLSAVSYVMLSTFSIWALINVCKQALQRRKEARKPEKRKLHFRAKEYRLFLFLNNILSFVWVSIVYSIWFKTVVEIDDEFTFGLFLIFAPFIITTSYNIISSMLNKTLHLLVFSSVVILWIISVWPGATELSRMVFYRLGIGGEIPVQIALLPGNKLGLLEGVIRQSKHSGSIYEETLGPFQLILYGKEKIYLSTMADQECLPERAGAAPTNALCQRIFSIRTEYVASVDTTRSVRAGPGNSR